MIIFMKSSGIGKFFIPKFKYIDVDTYLKTG